MTRFYIRIIIYFLSFILSLYALSALDFNKMIKPNKVSQAQLLYIMLAMVLAYLFGEFLMRFMIYFQV